jgi:hypothetical protein
MIYKTVHERKINNMNKIYGFTGKSLNFWLSFFNFSKEDGIEKFCKVEYGTDWQWAYSHYQKNKSFPSAIKQAA